MLRRSHARKIWLPLRNLGKDDLLLARHRLLLLLHDHHTLLWLAWMHLNLLHLTTHRSSSKYIWPIARHHLLLLLLLCHHLLLLAVRHARLLLLLLGLSTLWILTERCKM